jgi:hypothetical protein
MVAKEGKMYRILLGLIFTTVIATLAPAQALQELAKVRERVRS